MQFDSAVGGYDGRAAVSRLKTDRRQVAVRKDSHLDSTVGVRNIFDIVPDDLLDATLVLLDGLQQKVELIGGQHPTLIGAAILEFLGDR